MDSADEIRLRNYATQMYAQVNEKWAAVGPDIFGGACGFALLSGPPVLQPALMLIGSNPGFSLKDDGAHIEKNWPATSWIPDADWDFTRKLKSIFQAADALEAYNGCILTNFLFFKSSSLSRQGRYGWLNVPAQLREDLEKFCYETLSGYVAASRPELILVLGIRPFERYARNCETVLSDGQGKRRLLVKGQLFGNEAFGIIHPTGSHVSNADWGRLSEWLKMRLAKDQITS